MMLNMKHGTPNAYRTHNCRCDVCRAFICSQQMVYYHRRTSAQTAQANERQRLWRRKILFGNRELVAELKSKPCTDCNQSFPPCAMHFDHLRDKRFAISKKMHVSAARLLEEISKCELVCGNCHAIRTSVRQRDSLPKPLSTRRKMITQRNRAARVRKIINDFKSKPRCFLFPTHSPLHTTRIHHIHCHECLRLELTF